MRGTRIPIVFVTLSVLYFLSVFAFQGFVEEATRVCIRVSARISFLFFCMAFTASAIQYQIKNVFSFWILMNRKFLGITFGVIHLIHLMFLGILQTHFHPVFEMAKMTSLIGGGGAYIFLIIMLVTSIEKVKKKMSARFWKAIHTLGMYWIASVFFTTYLKRVLTEREYIPLLVILMVALFLRILKLLGLRIIK